MKESLIFQSSAEPPPLQMLGLHTTDVRLTQNTYKAQEKTDRWTVSYIIHHLSYNVTLKTVPLTCT